MKVSITKVVADLLITDDAGSEAVGERRVEEGRVLWLDGGQVHGARHAAHRGLHRLLEISFEAFLEMTEISF